MPAPNADGAGSASVSAIYGTQEIYQLFRESERTPLFFIPGELASMVNDHSGTELLKTVKMRVLEVKNNKI